VTRAFQRTVQEDALLHILSGDNSTETLSQLALAAESGDVSRLDAILTSIKQATPELRRKCHPDSIRSLVCASVCHSTSSTDVVVGLTAVRAI
jgi:hypothetical protein